MRKRNIRIITRLDKEENERFKKRVKKSGLSQEAYVRSPINGYVPTEAPSPDYFAMMKELHYIGVTLNQIAKKAYVLNVLDVKRYDENIAMLNKAVIDITNAVMLPRKIERNRHKDFQMLSPTLHRAVRYSSPTSILKSCSILCRVLTVARKPPEMRCWRSSPTLAKQTALLRITATNRSPPEKLHRKWRINIRICH